MKRMHLKRRKNKKNNFINKIIIVFILFIVCIIYFLKIFNQKAIPQLLSYSEIQTKKIVSLIINNIISKEISNKINMEELFITTKDSNGDIKTIDFNSSAVNNLLSTTSDLVEKNLVYLEKGDIGNIEAYVNTWDGYNEKNIKKGIIYEIPSGIIFNNTILNNILPKLPVKMDLIGNIFCNLTTDINSYGINNALIKVNIEIQADIKILLPFVSETVSVSSELPIIMKIIESKVPEYYFSGYLNNPSLTTPIE